MFNIINMSSSIKVYLESKKAHTTFNETHKKFKLLNSINIKPNENIFHFNQNKTT